MTDWFEWCYFNTEVMLPTLRVNGFHF